MKSASRTASQRQEPQLSIFSANTLPACLPTPLPREPTRTDGVAGAYTRKEGRQRQILALSQSPHSLTRVHKHLSHSVWSETLDNQQLKERPLVELSPVQGKLLQLGRRGIEPLSEPGRRLCNVVGQLRKPVLFIVHIYVCKYMVTFRARWVIKHHTFEVLFGMRFDRLWALFLARCVQTL